MIYIEYISRRPGASLDAFHAGALQGQEGWDAAYGEDQLVWNAARTWRLGPEPEYLAVWHSPGFGPERIDDWQRVFRARAADDFEDPFRQVARIDAAGIYAALREPVRVRDGIYYAEFFRPRADGTAIADFYAERAARHGRFTLSLLVQRIGRLGPEPGGLAVWTIPAFADLLALATELDGRREPVELVAAGTYVDLGQEIL